LSGHGKNPFGWAIRRGLFSLIRADK
jgi:hypothetical protein